MLDYILIKGVIFYSGYMDYIQASEIISYLMLYGHMKFEIIVIYKI